METPMMILAGISAAASFLFLVRAGQMRAGDVKTTPALKRIQKQFQRRLEGGLPPWMEQWMEQAEKRSRKGQIRFKPVHYLLMAAALMALAVFVGFVLLKNVVAFGILVATAFILPEHLIRGQVESRRNQLLLQLGPAVRVLAAEHSGTGQVNRAVIKVADKLDPPLKDVFVRAARGFLAGRSHDQVFLQMLDDLDFEYGQLFVYSLRILADDAKKRDLLWWLAEQIASQVDDILEEKKTVVQERLYSAAAVLMMFPVLLVMLGVFPETKTFLVENPVGRAVSCICLASPLANILFDRMVNRGI